MASPHYECVVVEAGSSFRCIHKACDDLANEHPWHFHPEFELSWVMRSRGTRFIGDCIRPYEAGEIVLYGPNLPHCSRNDATGAEHITAQFDPVCLGGLLELDEAAALRDLISDARRAVIFADVAAAEVGDHMRALVTLTGMARVIKLAEILEILSRLPRTQLTTSSYESNVVVDEKLLDRLNKVQRYIDQRYRGIVSQSEIAETLGMTAPAFSKFIRAATGQTFMSMVKMARISEGCRLLVNTRDSITDVALECGYQHTSHFDRHFAELKGMSPSEFRRHMLRLAAANAKHLGAVA